MSNDPKPLDSNPTPTKRGFESDGFDGNPTEAKRIGAQSPRPFLAHSGPDATSSGQRGQFDVRGQGNSRHHG